ncbi:MAG: peptidoglycan D,D-transpeptidase FtsI family protein [Acidimicrobiales bacterium]
MTGGPPARPVHTRRRLVGLVLALTLMFVAVIGRVADLQLVNADRYVAYGTSQRLRSEVLPASRGSLLDRSGAEMVLSVPATTIWADPRHVTDPGGVAAALAPILQLDETDLRDRLGRSSGFEYLARQIDTEVADQVSELGLRGIYLRAEPARTYSSGSLARTVLGTSDIDGIGVSGIELQFDDLLTGTPGELVFERSLSGGVAIPVGEHQVSPPRRGDDLVLTIDRSLQFLVEDTLGEWIDEMDAQGGMAVVTVPATGEILALANLTTDDAGRIVPSGYNQAVVDVFAPGSVAKLVTVAGSLEEGLSGPERLLSVPDTIRVADSWFHDHQPHPTENWSVTRILVDSSNVGAIKLGQELGPDRLSHYLGEFGFGTGSGLGFPGESAGLVRPPDEWFGSDIGGVAIGTGISVTTLQVLSAYNVIANGGVYTPLRLVDAHVDGDGVRHEMPRGESRRVVSETTSRQVADMLSAVVEDGTGTRAAVPGYTVAGKTGTAWRLLEDGSYEDARGNRQYMATFVGFAPVEDPRISVIVVLDRPSNAYSGGGAAAPAFSRIAEHALRMLDVPPTLGGSTTDGDTVTIAASSGPSSDRVRAPAAVDPSAVADEPGDVSGP